VSKRKLAYVGEEHWKIKKAVVGDFIIALPVMFIV